MLRNARTGLGNIEPIKCGRRLEVEEEEASDNSLSVESGYNGL